MRHLLIGRGRVQWAAALLGLTACEQPPPAAAPTSAPPPAAYTLTTYPPPAPEAPATAAVRVERTPDPPKQVDGVWVYETPGQLLDAYLGGENVGRVRVSGRVGGVIQLGGSAGTRYLVGPDARRFLEVRMRDGGAEASQLRIAQGSLMTVECTATDRIGKNALLTDCVLK